MIDSTSINKIKNKSETHLIKKIYIIITVITRGFFLLNNVVFQSF